MNGEKQKIISDICPFYKEYGTCEQCNKDLDIDDPPCYFERMANAIINNNYHKQIEGEFILFKPRRENRNATYRCSVCGKLCSSYYNDVGEWKFCPNCGAKMKGGAE